MPQPSRTSQSARCSFDRNHLVESEANRSAPLRRRFGPSRDHCIRPCCRRLDPPKGCCIHPCCRCHGVRWTLDQTSSSGPRKMGAACTPPHGRMSLRPARAAAANMHVSKSVCKYVSMQDRSLPVLIWDSLPVLNGSQMIAPKIRQLPPS